MKDDIEYRIRNLKFAIQDYTEEAVNDLGLWEKGYREGRIFSMESELRFLEVLVKQL